MLSPNAAVEALRNKIDLVDKQIAALLKKRADLAVAIGMAKQKQGVNNVFLPKRERAVVKLAVKAAACRSALKKEHVKKIYSEIISACRSLQGDIIACVGLVGLNTAKEAVNAYLGSFVRPIIKRNQKTFLSFLLSKRAIIGIIEANKIDMPKLGDISPLRQALNAKTLAVIDRFWHVVNNKKIEFCVLQKK